MCLQKTIKGEVKCRSVGLHSGRKINMTIKPAGVDEGIVFVRKDLPGKNSIKASLENVFDTILATTIGINGAKAATVEHLLSAFRGLGIDNAVVEIDAHEIPAMDGSALPFVMMLKDAGVKVQSKYKKRLVIKKKVYASDGVGTAMFEPFPEFKISYDIDFEHPLIGPQSYQMIFSESTYEREICAARTFGFLRDVEYLQAKGLALGGSLQNAVVLDNNKVINKEGLRCPDEFVKHKILDAIGDLSLVGMPIIGHFIAYKSGHTLNNLLLQELLSHKDNWMVTSSPQGDILNDFVSNDIPSFMSISLTRS
jgi:UDP-3-O-[3-hydroxymyristoyl] N-acetylglucosamine deacetylase